MQSPKAFEYHNFLRDVLRRSDDKAYFLASEKDFLRGALPRFPYRNYFYGIGMVKVGERRIRIGMEEFTLSKNTVMMIGPGIIRQWLDDDFSVITDTIFFTPELFKPPINPHFLSDLDIFKPSIQHIISLSEEDILQVQHLFDMMSKYQHETKIMATLVLSLTELMEYLYQNTHNQVVVNLSKHQKLLRDFDALLQKHYLENKDVAFYAEKLNLTPNHFSESIKSATGKSAKKRIETMLLLEAKSLLKQTTMSIKEVTYWLGFEDPSYFTKFFKNNVGLTPNEYKQQK
jgi:AraC family transcriptional regulator, transcriptional activator of pobA